MKIAFIQSQVLKDERIFQRVFYPHNEKVLWTENIAPNTVKRIDDDDSLEQEYSQLI